MLNLADRDMSTVLAVCGIALYVVLSAVGLRIACWLVNQAFVRQDSDVQMAVPVPNMGRALAMQLFILLVSGAATYFATQVVIGSIFTGPNVSIRETRIAEVLISLPICFVISSGLYSRGLPTSFGKACLANVLQTLMLLPIVAVIVFALVLFTSPGW